METHSSADVFFQDYCKRLEANTVQEVVNPNVRRASTQTLTQPIRKELQKELGLTRGRNAKVCPAMVRNRFAVCSRWVEETRGGDSDGEVLELCDHCRLPLADKFFEEKNRRLHAECLAQHWVREMQDEEKNRSHDMAKQKQARREEYDIGWKASHIPRNSDAASKLVMHDVRQGMVCLVRNESDASVRIAATTEPAAAINLEYFSLALQCRHFDGHEPYFSLEAIDPSDKNSMQEKVFEPTWLAGTSVGDVLFQADYYLKELSMGECSLPVAGMKSCLDYDAVDNVKEWNAREWFFVKNAEVQLSESNVLVPCVKMGVEAREQVMNNGILEDAPITRQSHPMVKFALEFTHKFDLIAERKSVVFHLRELAKASVLAKFVLEVDFQLEEVWFSLGDENMCSMEVPQLWNERKKTKVCVEDDIVKESDGIRSRGVYGGVSFGLDKFTLSARPISGVAASLSGFTTPVAMSLRLPPARIAVTEPSEPGKVFKPKLQNAMLRRPEPPQVIVPARPRPEAVKDAPVRRRRPGPQVTPAPRAAVQAMQRTVLAPVSDALEPNIDPLRAQLPDSKAQVVSAVSVPRLPTFSGSLQGVDLRLDQFDLSTPKKVSFESEEIVDDMWKPLDDCAAVAELFWASLDEETSLLDGDRPFLKNLFNPLLSDRRIEGDCFMPPDVSHHYVAKLKGLVKEEENLRQKRKEHFFSKDFTVAAPGNLFPPSWASAFEVVTGEQDKITKSVQSPLHPRPEFVSLDLWQHVLETSRADFDRTAEDGLRLRIYKLVNLEIRTSQEVGGDEIVGAVFSTRPSTKDKKRRDNAISGYDTIVRAIEYVEAGGPDKSGDDDVEGVVGDAGLYRHYFVVLETGSGCRIVTEQLANGHTTWQEDPDDVDSRSSCAKVIRTVMCCDGVCVQDVKSYQESQARNAASQSACKWYARGVQSKACGQAEFLRHQYRQANTEKRAAISNSPLLSDAPCID